MNSEAILSYALALSLTLVIELAVAALLRSWKLWRQVLLVNLVTHPLLNAGLALYLRSIHSRGTLVGVRITESGIVFLELIVVLVEAGLLIWAARMKPLRALGLALAMNAASYGIGLLIFGV